MKSIVLIQPYFGKWPLWFDAHLLSIAKNPTINWVFVTDCIVPIHHPGNIKFIETTLNEFNEEVNTILRLNILLSARKLCDLRLAYGDIFAKEISEYDFWGFCDMDIIWGDIRKYITKDLLNNYELISSRKQNMSGHFSIFKNNEKLNKLYKNISSYEFCLSQKKLMRCDEELLSNYLKKHRKNYAVFWDKILLNKERGIDSHQEYYLDRWLWKDGKVINTQTQEEVMYLHFINWKRTMNASEVFYINSQNKFYISYNKIHFNLHTKIDVFLNNIKNVFNGYWVREKRRLRKLKFNSIKKRIKIKINLK